MPKESLRDKLDGNELDLSLSDLEIVPVRELAALPKATHLDLSCNKITTLPPDFCSLTHIIKLDLSKNALSELPKDFGNLSNLQHLDLLGNKLTTLPRSFCRLRKLKWLDLKDNPLEGGLKKNAGDCLDEVECRKCATRILMYMRELDSQLERQWQNKLKKQREEEAQQKEAEEKERQRKRQEKKAEKERRRRELEAKRAQERIVQNGDTSDEEVSVQREKLKHTNHRAGKKSKDSRGGSCILLVFFSFLVLLVALLVALDFHCQSSSKDQLCALYWQPVRKEVVSFVSYSRSSILKIYNQNIRPLFS